MHFHLSNTALHKWTTYKDMKCHHSLITLCCRVFLMAPVIPAFTSDSEPTVEQGATACDQTGFNYSGFGTWASTQKSWALVYKKPHIACIIYFVSAITGIAAFGWLHIAGFPWMTLKAHIPILLFVGVSTVQVVGMWLMGPAYGSTQFSKPFQLVGAGSGVYTIAASFAGPLDFTPFQDRLLNVTVTGLSCLLMYISSAFGGVAADLPPEPYQGLVLPLANSAFTALKLTDAGTDLGFMRMLWEQVCQAAA